MDEQEIQFIDPPDYEINCLVCFELLTGEVCQTTCCGNHICSDCTTRLKATPNIKCPKCRNENFDAHLDIFFPRLLLSRRVRCDYWRAAASCPWTGELCERERHLATECNKGLPRCQYCNNLFPSVEEHLPVCGDFILDCPNKCCNAEQKRKNFQDHLENKCPLRVITPTIANARIPQAANGVVQIVPLSFTMTHFGHHLEREDPWYSPPFYTHDRGYKMNIRVFSDYGTVHVSANVNVLKGEHDDTLQWPLCAEVEVSLLNWRANANHVTKKIYLPGDHFCDRLLTRNMATEQGVGKQFVSLDELVYNADNNTEYLSYNCLSFQVKNVTIFPILLPQKLPRWATQDCICHFVLHSFTSNKEREVEFYGPPFYTHERGYKLSVVVYPNGFSNGEGTHVSVSVDLQNGEFDNELAWPFSGDVTVEIVNWTREKSSQLASFSFNLHAFSFISRSLIQFKVIPHSSLKSLLAPYLYNDCLLIKVKSAVAYSSHNRPIVPQWRFNNSLCDFTLNQFTTRKQCNNQYYSKPFFTHPNGYKMQLKVDANDNGYIAVYAYLMKGPNDDKLVWPFCGDVVVELVNWIEDAGHLQKVFSFSPNNNSAVSCNRVTASGQIRNTAGYGTHQFIKHSAIESRDFSNQFLHEDCLYFRVKEVAVYSINFQQNLHQQNLHQHQQNLHQENLHRQNQHNSLPSLFFTVFTVADFSRHKKENIDFLSPEFFTHDGGYKLQLEIKATSGETTCQHVGVYARLLRSKNDANLIWPFRASIFVELTNWRGDFNHHRHVITFDEQTPENSCQILTEEKALDNWGTHKFIPYSSLGYNRRTNSKYLQDDCLRFKVNDVIVYSTPLAQKRPFWQNDSQNFLEFTIPSVSKLVRHNETYCSPPFFTSDQGGYKMCLRVCPGGYGSGMGTHVAIFGYLMKGENDDNLIWPFTADIALDILNWKGDHDHHRAVLQFDNSDEFCGPRVPHGSVFSSHSKGEHRVMPLRTLFNTSTTASTYVEDDCMRIRVCDIAVYSTPLLNKKPQWQDSWDYYFSVKPMEEFTVTGVSKHMLYNSAYISCPFYTHNVSSLKFGYKLRLEVYPKSGGNSTHLAIYARLQKGAYDYNPHLKWPMDIELSVEIVNWRTNASHILKIIKFSNTAPYSARMPITDNNIASYWGVSDFCSHETLFTETEDIQYIQDDCICVRINGVIIHSRDKLAIS